MPAGDGIAMGCRHVAESPMPRKPDVPGGVKVLDEQRILIADRPGNNRLDRMANILDTPSVGTLFLIPGIIPSGVDNDLFHRLLGSAG